jgi:hypothetical protein
MPLSIGIRGFLAYKKKYRFVNHFLHLLLLLSKLST